MKTLLASALLLLAAASAAEIQLVNSEGKTAWLYTPTDAPDPNKTCRLAIGIHGAGADGKGACDIASWVAGAVIVLGPTFSASTVDPAAPKTGGMPADSYQMAGPTHVAKLKALVGEVGKTWKLHPKFFLHGFSAGAQFAHRFAMIEPDLVAGVSAGSGGSWATRGFGTLNPAARGIPFSVTCGEHDRKKSWPDSPLSRIDWMKEFAVEMDKAGFDITSRVIENNNHEQHAEALAAARSCFARARALNFSRTALMAFDFNADNPMWGLVSEANGPGVTALAKWDFQGGMIEEGGSSRRTGALRLAANSGPDAPDWRASMTTRLLPVRGAESDLRNLTFACDLSVSSTQRVEVNIESYNSDRKRSGGLTGILVPAAPDFYHRHILDLGKMTASGEGAFKALDPFVKITFRIGADLGWPAASGHQVRVDNLGYAAPAIHVSAAGDDNNDGSGDQPLATVQKALDRAQAGDVVMVMDGTYTSDRSVANIRGTGAPAAWLVLRAHPGHRPVFRSTWWDCIKIGQGNKERPSTTPATAYVEIRGLTIQGYGPEVEAKFKDKIGKREPETNGNGISVSGRFQQDKPHHIRLADCTVFDCPGGGVSFIHAERIAIENNHIYQNCKWMIYAGSGISILQAFNFEDTPCEHRLLIRNNRTHDNLCTQIWEATGKLSDGNGIIVDDLCNTQGNSPNGVYQGRTLVQGNVSYRNGGSGMHAFSSNHVDFINNTAIGNNLVMDYAQISLTRCTDCRMLNNIIVAPADKPINRVNGSSQDIVISHNLYWGGSGPPTPSDSPVTADPLFVDAANGDFRLKPGSPAIGAGGRWENLPATYQDGSPRGTGIPDLGAMPVAR